MDHAELGTRVGAYVLCERDGALLLARLVGSGDWTLPGGGLDHGEHPADAARREVTEETGLQVVLGPLLGVHSAVWHRSGGARERRIHAVHIIYRGAVTGGELRAEVGGSTDAAAWVPLADVATRPASGVLRTALDLRERPA